MRKTVLSYANNKGADQPAHPRSLISAFVVRCVDSLIPMLAKTKLSRLYLYTASAAEQAGLSRTWSQTQNPGLLMTWPILYLTTQTYLAGHLFQVGLKSKLAMYFFRNVLA